MTMEEAYSRWLVEGEWLRAANSRGWEGVAAATWRAAYAAGQKAEREACAQIADDMDYSPDGAIGAAIRNRGEN